MNTSIRKVLAVIALVLVFAGLGVGIGFLRDKSGGGDSSTMNNATTYESGPFRVTISVNPSAPRVGKNQLTVKVADAQGDPAFGEMPAMGAMSAMRAPADLEEREPGMYAGPLALEMRGEWPLSLSIEKDGIGETRLGFDMATGRTGLAISSGGRPVRGAESRTETMAGGSAPTKDGCQCQGRGATGIICQDRHVRQHEDARFRDVHAVGYERFSRAPRRRRNGHEAFRGFCW